MAATRVNLDQFTYNGGSPTTVQVLTGPLTSGNLLVLTSVLWQTRQILSVTQTGATWIKAVDTPSGSDHRTEIWYAENISPGASSTITVVLDTTPGLTAGFFVMEYTGVATIASLDRTVSVVATDLTAPQFKDPTVTSDSDELHIWALGCTSVGFSTDRQHMAYDNIALQDYGSLSQSVFEMTKNIRGEPQGACRSSGASVVQAMCFASFKPATPFGHNVARIQTYEDSGNAGVGPWTVFLDKFPTANNLVVAIISTYGNHSVGSILQSGVTWVQAASHNAGPSSFEGIQLEVWFGTVGSFGGSNEIILSMTPSTQNAILYAEYEGLIDNDISIIDTIDTNDGVGTLMDTGLGTLTSGNRRLLIAAMGAVTAGEQFDHHSPSNNFSQWDKAEGGSSGFPHSISGMGFGAEAAGQFQAQLTNEVSAQWATILLSLEAPPPNTVPPEVTVGSPASGETEVSRLSSVSFNITGPDGVDLSSLEVTFLQPGEGLQGAVVDGVLQQEFNNIGSSITSITDGYAVVLQKLIAWKDTAVVNVSINATNDYGVLMPTVNYFFTTSSELPSTPVLLQKVHGAN